MESSRQKRILDLALKKMAAQVTPLAATPAAAERTFTRLHEAAAVVATFQVGDLHKLDPSPRDVDVLLADSLPAQDPASSGGWTLAPQIRSEILTKTQHPALRELLERSGALASSGDPFRSALQQLPAIDSLNVAQLAAISPFAPALETAFPSLPPRDDLERRLENLRLLEPFERLVGHFAGRQKQLEELRDYVEVLPPSSLLARGARLFSSVFRTKKPLLLHAAGGAGKSTLIARFILDHARLPESQRFPFAYLDFDRPTLLASEPATILLEAVRQIGLQYPVAYHQGERLRAAWTERIDSSARRRGSSSRKRSADTATRAVLVREFAQLLNTLEVIEGPLLLVLDTFEEVQYLGRLYVKELGKFLSQLSAAVPRLRTVIAGRVDEKDISFAKKIPLPDFDELAAIGFLSANGVSDAAFAKTIVKQFGGNPLTLLLAAQVAQTEAGRKDLASISTTRVLGLVPVAVQHIQGQLFERILKHIHRAEVRQIAYPGLVLRRVTPEIIREVLAGPCEIPIPTLAEARVLFRELRREESLVSSGGGEVLIPRNDVRRLMLRSVRDTKPRETRKIDENAVAYYSRSPDPASRAEEIYHRLFLGEEHESIATRFIDGVEEHLANAMEELQAPEKVLLADRLGIDLPADLIGDVPHQLWERSAERRVREALDVDDAEAALEILGERSERTGKTLLHVQHILAHAAAGQLDEAASVAKRARAQYEEEGNLIGLFETLLAAAEVDRRLLHFDDALQKLAGAAELASASRDPLQNVRVLVGRALVLTDRREDAAAVRKEISRFAAQTSDEVWNDEHVLLRLAAVCAGIDDVPLLARAVRIAGFTHVLPRQWAAIESLLGRKGITEEELLDELETGTASQELRAAVIDMLRNDTRVSASDAPAQAAEAPRVKLGVTAQERKEIADVLLRRFPTRPALDMFLSDNFDRRLDTLSLANDLFTTVNQVIDHAARGEWFTKLVDVLRHETEGLEGLVSRIGLGAVVEDLGRGSMPAEELRKLAEHGARRLTEIEGRMCRIEAGEQLIKTGFLVANDVVITSGAEVPIGAVARFDYAEVKGQVVSAGTPARIIQVIPIPPLMRPQTILLRLDRPIGHEPVFGARDTRPRGYFELRETDDLVPLRVVWLWHEGALKLGGTEKVLDAEQEIMRFDVRPQTAFEGAPCFDMGFHLVALHCGEDPYTGACIARSVRSLAEHAEGFLHGELR